MSEQLQLRRGTATQVAAFTGAQGEVVVDTTNNRLVLQDGATAGGFAAAKLTEVVTNARRAVADAPTTIVAGDRLVAYAALTTSRAVTLCAASDYPTGTILTIVDESGSCSATNAIVVSGAGSDTIDGQASYALNGAYAGLSLESNGSNAWTVLSPSPNVTASLIGIGAAPDPANPLSVTANAVLFSQSSSGASPGDIRVNLNKAASANTASLVFQDNFSERAEIGLTDDDNFHFKVSADGSTWHDSLEIDVSTGYVGVGTSSPLAPLEVSANTGAPTPPFGAQVYFVNADSANTFLAMDAYGFNVHSDLLLRQARGTGASPTATQLGDTIGQIQWRGYGATEFAPLAKAALQCVAAENWSDTAQGTYFSLKATPQGSIIQTEILRIVGNGQIVYFGAQADQSKSDQTPTTGFSITVSNAITTLLLKPSGSLASGTILMPAAPVDGQMVRVLSSQTVTTLTVSPNSGQSISGAPSTITPTTPFAMIYDFAATTWYRMA